MMQKAQTSSARCGWGSLGRGKGRLLVDLLRRRRREAARNKIQWDFNQFPAEADLG